MISIDEMSSQAPLWSALCRQANRISFHMPAHRQGRVFSREWIESLTRCDTTELERTGDLTVPSEHVKEAYDLAAAYFGAGETWFVTTGTTIAIRVMIASALFEGDAIIMPRAVHMAAVHAVALLGLNPHFVTSSDGRRFEDGQPDAESFIAAMRTRPDAKAVYVTCPDYYGRTIDLRMIAVEAHRLGMTLLVDEAHGAHFAAAPGILPPTALSQGADFVVQSAHKTLPALTPASLLHLSKDGIACGRLCPLRVAAMVRVFQTSSPSFMIAASTDLARAVISRQGYAPWQRLTELNRQVVDLLPAYYQRVAPPGSDKSRLVIDYSRLGRGRKEMVAKLDYAGIDAELVDHRRIVFIPAIDHPESDYEILARTLSSVLPAENSLFAERHVRRLKELENLRDSLFSARASWLLTPRQALFGDPSHAERSETMAKVADHAENHCGGAMKMASHAIAPYPPGMPIAWPGENIGERHDTYIQMLQESNVAVYD